MVIAVAVVSACSTDGATQAKLEFYIIGSDEHECYNFNQLVTGVTTTPSPYVGEFVQFDVTNVTRAP